VIDKNKLRAKVQRKEARRRTRCLEIFGKKCAICGFADERALQFDHIKPVGGKRKRGRETYRRILSGVDPVTDYQLLCANCHAIKTRTHKDYAARPEAPIRPKKWLARVWLTCPHCKIPFLVQRSSHSLRKYCSRECLVAAGEHRNEGWRGSFVKGVYTQRGKIPPLIQEITKSGGSPWLS
jgi:hypothetical protein